MKRILTLIVLQMGIFHGADGFVGGMDVGGGYGYVCFEEYDQAQKVVNQDYQLAEEDFSKIIRIAPIDLVVAEEIVAAKNGRIFEPYAKESLDDFLIRLQEHLEEISPRLVEKILDAQEEFKKIGIENRDTLPRPEDHGQFFGAKKGVVEKEGLFCVAIPMAVQISAQLGFPYMSERINKLNFDKKLREHKNNSVMSQAVLWLHEMIYFVARNEAGHENSAATTMAITYLIAEPGVFTEEKIDSVLETLGIFEE